MVLIRDATDMKINSPSDLLFDQLRDLHSMEMQLMQELPQLAEMAGNSELREIIIMHAFRSVKHADQLMEVFANRSGRMGPEVCRAMQGLLEEGPARVREVPDPATRDMMMVGHYLRIRHYAYAAYAVAARLAESIRWTAEAEMLAAAEVEQRAAIRRLYKIEFRLIGGNSEQRMIEPVF